MAATHHIIKSGRVTYQVADSLLTQQGLPLEDIDLSEIYPNRAFSLSQLVSIVRIMNGDRLQMMVHLDNMKDTYEMLKYLVPIFKVDASQIEESFSDWVKSLNLKTMAGVAYIYLVYDWANQLSVGLGSKIIDYKRVFRTVTDYFSSAANYTAIPELIEDSSIVLRMHTFFEGVDLADIGFDANNRDTQAKVEFLKASRKTFFRKVGLIDPHTSGIEIFYRPTEFPDGVWECKDIAKSANHLVRPEPGTRTLCTFDEATANMKKVIGLSDEQIAKFPEGVLICGGSVAMALNTNFGNGFQARSTDVDVFGCAKTRDERVDQLKDTLNMFAGFADPTSAPPVQVYYAVYRAVINIHVTGKPRTIQFVSSQAEVPYDTMANFDLSHIQCAWNPRTGRFYMTAAAIQAMTTLTTQIRKTHNLRYQRLLKALCRGFDLSKTDLVDRVDLASIVGNLNHTTTQNLISTIQEVSSFDYKMSYTPEENETILTQQATREFNGSVVVRDPVKALELATPNGDFETNYQRVTAENIEEKVLPQVGLIGVNTFMLRCSGTNKGTVTVMVEGMITSVTTDEHISITIEPTEETSKLIDVLEKKCFPQLMLKNPKIPDADHIIQGGKIQIIITKQKQEAVLAANATNNRTFLMNQSNVPMCFEDICSGQPIKVMSSIKIESSRTFNGMKLMPNCLILTVKENTNEIGQTQDAPDMAAAAAYDGRANIEEEL